jgi:threonine dehydrogenase-like Zn-dependent dehydrogenase
MSHASHGVMTPSSLFKVPDGVSDEEASFIELGIICLQGVRKAAIRPGERVAVIGQGLIGQLAARLARLAGAGSIVAVASSARRMQTALHDGAADEFVSLAESPEAVDRIQADVVIEAVGSSPAITIAMTAARHGGRVVLLGSSRDLGRNLDWPKLAQQRELTLVGAHIGVLPQSDTSAGMWTYGQEGRLFMLLLGEGRLKLRDLVTWRPRPQECNRVYEVMAGGGGEHVGVVFDWSGSPGPVTI